MESENAGSVFKTPAWLTTVTYLGLCCWSGIVLAVLGLFWGDHMLMSFADITSGDVSGEGLGRVWFIFAWALAVTVLLIFVKGLSYSHESRLIRSIKGSWLSLNAGVFEELVFRWMLFFTAMIMLPFLNFVTFGLVKWFYVELLIPVANWFTFGALEPHLAGGSWVLGAAIISVNADFRDGHKYLGPLGWINSWFIGMVMFYLVLNYNLQTAIVAHVLYDLIIFGIVAVAVKGSQRVRHHPVVWNTGWNQGWER